MTRGLLLSVLCAALSATPLEADVLPPGSRGVRHELVLEASEVLDGWTLAATPVRGFGGVTVIEPGVPFTFSSKYGTRVYALPAGSPVADEPDAVRAAASAEGEIPVAEVTSTPLVSPLTGVVTTLRVVAIEDGVLTLEVAGERSLGVAGLEVRTGLLTGALALVACAGLATVLELARRARRAG